LIDSLKQFSWRRLSSSILQAFGTLWLAVEVTAYFFSERTWASDIKSGWWIFLILGVVIGVWRARPKRSVQARIAGTDVVVQVRICDLLKQSGTFIVGSNSTFDTAIEDNTIASSSVQGQFTIRCCGSVPELDQKLENALNPLTPARVLDKADKPYGKQKEYELGTVAPIEVGGKRAYFVAVASLNKHRVASSDRNGFLDALPRMWSEIRNRGGIEPICCPVIGSGFSRLNLTREKLIQELVRSFVAATQEAKFCEKLTVVIHPKDVLQGRIDMAEMGRFLEYECIYSIGISRSVNTVPEGTPLP